VLALQHLIAEELENTLSDYEKRSARTVLASRRTNLCTFAAKTRTSPAAAQARSESHRASWLLYP